MRTWRLPSTHLKARVKGDLAEKQSSTLPQWSVFLVVFLHLLGFTMGGPILPALRTHFSVAPAQMGLITSVFPLGMFIAVFVFPSLSDAIGRKPVLTFCCVGVGMGFVLQGLAIQWNRPFSHFLFLRFLSGVFAGATTVLKAYIADVSDRASLPRAMAYREAAGILSYIVGPTLGGMLFSLFGLSFTVMFSGLTSLLAACCVLVFPAASSRKAAHHSDDQKGTQDIATQPPATPRRVWRVVVVMICIHFLYNFGQSFFDGFFTLFCAERFGLQPAVLGPMLTALACLVFLNSTFMYSRLVSWVGLVPTAIIGLLFVTFGLMSLGASQTIWAVVVSMLFYGFGVPYFKPSVPTVLAQCAPPQRRGLVLGIDSAVSAAARTISPTLMGILYQQGPVRAFQIAGMVILCGAFLAVTERGNLSRI